MSTELIDVQMPDGQIVSGVPKGTTQAEVLRRYNLAKNQDILKQQAAKYPTAAEGGNPDIPWYLRIFSPGAAGTGQTPAAQGLTKAAEQAGNVVQGIPQAVTGIPSAVSSVASTIRKGLSGDASGAIRDVYSLVKSGATPLTVPLRQATELAAPGLVNAPTPDAPETAQAAQGAGALLGGALLGRAVEAAPSAFQAIKGQFQSAGLDAPTINRWMDVPSKEVRFGANPGKQLLDENLLGETKRATQANVNGALTDSGQQLQKALNDSSTGSIDATDIVGKPLAEAKKAYGAPTEETFRKQLDAIKDKAISDHPNLNNMTPADAHRLKVELGESIKWTGAAYDTPINQAMIKIYRGLNDAIKSEAPGAEAAQSRWGNLYIASKNLAESIADDDVGRGTGAATPTAPPSPAAAAAKAAAPYAIRGAAGALGAGAAGATGYGIYRFFKGQPER